MQSWPCIAGFSHCCIPVDEVKIRSLRSALDFSEANRALSHHVGTCLEIYGSSTFVTLQRAAVNPHGVGLPMLG